MSSRRSTSHSTGAVRTAYFEDDSSLPAHSPDSTSSESLSSAESWQQVTDDDIEPSDSASRPPRVASSDRDSSRRSSRSRRTHEPRPSSARRKSSLRVPTIREEEHRPHRSHSGRPHSDISHSDRSHSDRAHSDHSRSEHSDRHEHYHYPGEREQHRHSREHRHRVHSSGSSSTDSYEAYMSGGAGYDLPHHPHPNHPSPWHNVPQHAPQPPHSNYPPTVMSGHTAYDAYGHPIPPAYDALIRMPRNDPMSPMNPMNPMNHYGAGFAPQGNPFAQPSSSTNPFSPMASNASAAGDYFNSHDPRPSPNPQQHPGYAMSRPPPRSRPQSYGGPPYDQAALSPYNAVGFPYGGMPPNVDPNIIIARHLHEMQKAERMRSDSTSPERPRTKSKSPAPPPPVAEVKEEPKEDQAVRLIALLAEYDDKKRAAAEEKLNAEASAAAAEKAKKDAADMESVKIENMLLKWREEQEKREKERNDQAEAAKAVAEEKAKREAELAAAISAAKEAAEKDAAEKAKAAAEEYAKKVAEATAAAEAAEKAKKALEENVAKLQPAPDDSIKGIHFLDVLGRSYDLPWKLAKTWKGMRHLVEQAFAHIEDIGRDVLDGRYDLMGPDGRIILPQVWEMVIQPDWDIKMELWPVPANPVPEVMVGMPGGMYPVADVERKDSKKKDGKSKQPGTKPKKPSLPAHMIPVPPPAMSGDPVPFIYEDKPAKKPKPKPKVKTTGFASWMMGTRPRAPAGKDSEKLSSRATTTTVTLYDYSHIKKDKHHDKEQDYHIVERKASDGSANRKSAANGVPVAEVPACSVM